MTPVNLTSGTGPIFFIIAIVAISMFRRIRSVSRGTRFNATKTKLSVAFYVALGCLFCAMSFYEGVALWFAAPYAILFAVAALWSHRYSDRRIIFWKAQDGSVYFKGGTIIYLVYLAGMIARLLINVTIIKSSVSSSLSNIITLSGAALYGAMATDILFLLGVGLLFGRSIKALKRYQMIERGGETLSSEPGA